MSIQAFISLKNDCITWYNLSSDIGDVKAISNVLKSSDCGEYFNIVWNCEYDFDGIVRNVVLFFKSKLKTITFVFSDVNSNHHKLLLFKNFFFIFIK